MISRTPFGVFLFVCLGVLYSPRIVHGGIWQFLWVTNDNAITITSYYTVQGPLIIPDTINGYPVTCISNLYYTGNLNTNATALIIPDSVVKIGARTFSYLTRLKTLNIPDGVTNMAEAFIGCSGLTNVTLGRGVADIGRFAFRDCFNLHKITVDPLNASYSSTWDALLDKEKKILIQYVGTKSPSYAIPGTVTNIEDYAFFACPSLSKTL